MKVKIILVALLSLLFLPAISFALTREEVINDTLKKIEKAQSSQASNRDLLAEANFSAQFDLADSEFPDELETEGIENRDISGQPETNNFFKGNFYISADYDLNYLNYKEFDEDEDNILDEDYGTETGFYIAAGFKSKAYIKSLQARPYIEAYYRRFDDLVTYDGAATNGVTTWPFEHEEKSKVEQFGVKVGGRRNLSPKLEMHGYIDLGQRNWYRGESETIAGVATYKELYRWIYFGVGMGLDYSLIPKLSCGLEAEWLPAIEPEMYADNWFLTVPERTTFELKNVYGIELKMPIKYYLLKNLSFDVTPYFTYWTIKQSDPVLTSDGYYYEPDSTTHIEGVLAGFTYSF